MNPTLTEILAGLYEAHREIDRLQAELAQRDRRIAELEAADPKDVDGPSA